ncbi:N/A [soil metagenome]
MALNNKIIIYSAESGISNPGKMIKSMIYDFEKSNALGLCLAKRNINALYRQSLLGYIWSVVPPLMTSLVWVFLNSQNVVSFSTGDIPYPLFVLTGTLLWQIFSESILAPLKGVQTSLSMLTKINFPRESLILTGIYEVLFNSFIKLALIVGIFLYYNIVPGPSVVIALLGIITIIIFGSTIGLLLTPIGLLYSDIGRGIGVILQFAIYLTPVIYPEPKSGIAAAFMKYNPLAELITITRNGLLESGFETGNLIFISILSFFMFLMGMFIYRIAMPIIIERVGS